MKKRYAMTLLEVMIVIFIIGIIGSVIGYNMRGSLDKGKAFKTREGINKLYEIVQLEDTQGNSLKGKENLEEAVKNVLSDSGLVRKPADLMKDGWGNTYQFKMVGPELRIYSEKYENYCKAKNIDDPYPWSEEDSHS